MKLLGENQLQCAYCFTLLEPEWAVDGVIECRRCGNHYDYERENTPAEAVHFLRQGEHELDIAQFDGAVKSFQKAVELAPKEPKAHFALALAEQRVRYLRDVVNNRLQLICYQTDTPPLTENSHYQTALKLATSRQKAEYEQRAKEVEHVKTQFVQLKKRGVHYDCFLCVKVTGADGQPTADSKDADYIYNLLQDNGYRPFYSERSLRHEQGLEYETAILYALSVAETMLIICRDESYLRTPWVENEYQRFLQFQFDGDKESDSLTFVFSGQPVERLPGRPGKIQGIDFAKRGADQQILDFVARHTPQAKARREQAKAEKAAESERLNQRFAEMEAKMQQMQTQSPVALAPNFNKRKPKKGKAIVWKILLAVAAGLLSIIITHVLTSVA